MLTLLLLAEFFLQFLALILSLNVISFLCHIFYCSHFLLFFFDNFNFSGAKITTFKTSMHQNHYFQKVF